MPASQISEQDVLSHAHVRNLGILQQEIHRLRADLPSVLKPIMTAKLDNSGQNNTSAAAASATTTPAKPDQNPQEDFREKAVNLQRDTRQLIKRLEEMCDTLEATERIRNEDKVEQQAATKGTTAKSGGITTTTKRVPFERVDPAKGQILADAPTSPQDPLASISIAQPQPAGPTEEKTQLDDAATPVQKVEVESEILSTGLTPAAAAMGTAATPAAAALNPAEVPAVTDALATPLAEATAPDTGGETTALETFAGAMPLDDTLFSDLEAAGDFDWSAFGQTPPSTL